MLTKWINEWVNNKFRAITLYVFVIIREWQMLGHDSSLTSPTLTLSTASLSLLTSFDVLCTHCFLFHSESLSSLFPVLVIFFCFVLFCFPSCREWILIYSLDLGSHILFFRAFSQNSSFHNQFIWFLLITLPWI